MTLFNPPIPEFAWGDQIIFSEEGLDRPQIQSYQTSFDETTLLGYTFDDHGEIGSHFVQILSSWSETERRARLLRMACHFLVDSTPDEGMSELLEKTEEIRQYYCSLTNWVLPELPAVTELGPSVVTESHMREPFAFPEE